MKAIINLLENKLLKVGFINKMKIHFLIKSSLGIIAVSMLVKVMGYIEKVVLAYYFGTNYKVDVYTLIITTITSIFIFFRELIEPGFLNVFLKAKNDGDEEGAWHLFNCIGRWILLITILLSAAAFFYPEKVVDIFAPGFTGDKRDLCVNLIQYSFPAVIFLSLSALTNITLNALKEFSFPASADLAFKGAIVLSLVLLYKSMGIYAVVVGILFGSFCKLAVHLYKLIKYVKLKKLQVNIHHVKSAWSLTWPLLIGVSFSQLSSLIDNVFASYLQEGSISALSYAKKITELPVVIFPYVLSIVVFPYFSQLSIENNKERLSELLSQTLKWITIVFLPLSVFYYMFSPQLVEIILQRGAFNAGSAALTILPAETYSLGLLAFAIETILVIFYFANGDTKTPIFTGIACVLLNIGLTFLLIKTMGHNGIALALVISKSIKVAVLLYLLKNKIQVQANKILFFMFKILIATILVIFATYIFNVVLFKNQPETKLLTIAYLTIAFLSCSILYTVTLYFLNKFQKN